MPELDRLVAELRAVVQRYSLDWTNSDAGDPGTTLLELFAFLAEDFVRRADQILGRSRPHLAGLSSQLRMPSRYRCSGLRRDEGALP